MRTVILSSLSSPIRTVSCGDVAGGAVLGPMGGSKLLGLVGAGAAPLGAAGAVDAGATAASAAPLVGGGGGVGNALCADAGLALSGTSTALPVAAVASAAVVVGLMSSCSSVL